MAGGVTMMANFTPAFSSCFKWVASDPISTNAKAGVLG